MPAYPNEEVGGKPVGAKLLYAARPRVAGQIASRWPAASGDREGGSVTSEPVILNKYDLYVIPPPCSTMPT